LHVSSWVILIVDDDNEINIYAVSDGLFYKEDEYDLDRKYLYKYLMNKIVDKLIESDG